MKYKNWSEFKSSQLQKNVDSNVLKLSYQILNDIKTRLNTEIVHVKFTETGFTLNVDKSFNSKRTVFSYFKFNKNSFILETIFAGKKSKTAKYTVKKNHVVNQFKIKSKSNYSNEVQDFLEDAFRIIKSNEYDLISKPLK